MAVALEFVISMDELLYEALAPIRTKRILSLMAPFRLHPGGTKKGLDLVTVLLSIQVGVSVFSATTRYMAPQMTGGVHAGQIRIQGSARCDTVCHSKARQPSLNPPAVLENIQSAICGGDQDFVYTIDSIGSFAWGYPESLNLTESPLQTPWSHDESERLNLYQYLLDGVLSGHGREYCDPQLCYEPTSTIPVPITGRPRALCCLPRQTRLPTVNGGTFSLTSKQSETIRRSTDLCALLRPPPAPPSKPTLPLGKCCSSLP